MVDLQDKNPQEVLKNYTTVENLRILVCGGDISLFYAVGGLTVRLDWLGVEHDREGTLEARARRGDPAAGHGQRSVKVLQLGKRLCGVRWRRG